MTWLVYMPYFDSNNEGNREAQHESLAWFLDLQKHADDYKLDADAVFRLDKTHGQSEDRLPFLSSIWGTYDIVYVESTKHPTLEQLRRLITCREQLCTQNYLTNIMLQNGGVFKFPAHKCFTDKPYTDVTKGCIIKTQRHGTRTLRYCDDTDEYADVTDLGILKISKQYQDTHAFTAVQDPTGHSYNSVERLHDMLFDYGVRWHRHKELGYRNGMYHMRTNNARDTVYLDEEHMRKKLLHR